MDAALNLKARKAAFGGSDYVERLTRQKLRQAFGRLIRRADDRGVFVLLSPLPSRLYSSFPGVTPERVTLAEAVAIANDSAYGLHAGVWSRNLDRAVRVSRALQAGTVHVNQYDEDDITVPFGGVKQSGNGRDKSLHAFDKYTELKTTWMRIDSAN